MRVLVIGGAGFIGCNVADYYLKRKHPVTIFDNFSRKGTTSNAEWIKGLYGKEIKIVRGDIRIDFDKMRMLISKHDIVFHMAAQVAVTTSVLSPREDFEINAMGTFNILEAIRLSKNKPFLMYASTNKVYGDLKDITIKEGRTNYFFKNLKTGVSEDMTLDFHSPYGCSKGASDQYVRDYARIYGLKTIVFRQSCIYGWRQFGIEDQGWVAHFIISAILNRPITIYGNGKQVRDILFIDDLIRAFDKAVTKIKITAGQVYNIGGGYKNQISISDFIRLLEKKLKKRICVSSSGWRPGDQPIYISNISKFHKDCGWKPVVDIDEGIDKMIRWITENKKLFEK